MKGLMKNNLYGTYTNAKAFSCFMILLGIFCVAVISPSLQIGYVLTSLIGFSVNTIIVTKNEFTTKWGKYKLTLPVKRTDIVKSQFLNQIIWLLAGLLFAGIELSLSWSLHGCPFDLPSDILSIFAFGISISLFMGAIFFPMFYIGGEERGDVFWIISLLCAFGIDLIIISIANALLAPGSTTALLGAAILIVCSLFAFALSYPLTVSIFNRKEF